MTLTEFRAKHGDPQKWCGPEIEEYLTGCDRVEAVWTRLDRAAKFIEQNPGASSAQIIAAYKGGDIG
ncbi:hypothetical protein ACIQZB_43535 [Streptomyces sp. NPDC097727]|uniref:hypothetical protein n=1 Tax=Streptomyces sp. NPDC097727 TaxID=3366092 RepID=UPI003825074F